MIKTWCEDCDHVSADTRKLHPARWTCTKFPWTDDHGSVARMSPTGKAIYNHCRDINKGFCPLYKERIPGQLEAKV
jgi:hypothetical protein